MENEIIYGFDFGTTNSLVAKVELGTRPDATVLSEKREPIPSAIHFHGETVQLGHEAKANLLNPGQDVQGNAIRSPKTLLNSEQPLILGGISRSTVEICSKVIDYVKRKAEDWSADRVKSSKLDTIKSVVATIPVHWDGKTRKRLREAFDLAGIEVYQFVHEPFAALYGYFRSHANPSEEVLRLNRQNVLVIDWGGGTLDITACRIDGSVMKQLGSRGNDQVGGDLFDEDIANFAKNEFISKYQKELVDVKTQVENLELTQRATLNFACELAKKSLSNTQEHTIFIDKFGRTEKNLVVDVTQAILKSKTDDRVKNGIATVRNLLRDLNLEPNHFGLVLLVGGMSAMKSIRKELFDIFGLERVQIPDQPDTLVARGAAWIAFDKNPLILAKPLEIAMASKEANYLQGYYPLIKPDITMPTLGQQKVVERVNLRCVDPSHGQANLIFCLPKSLSASPSQTEERRQVNVLSVKANSACLPLEELFVATVSIDENLICHIEVTSEIDRRNSAKPESAKCDITDLEFGTSISTLI